MSDISNMRIFTNSTTQSPSATTVSAPRPILKRAKTSSSPLVTITNQTSPSTTKTKQTFCSTFILNNDENRNKNIDLMMNDIIGCNDDEHYKRLNTLKIPTKSEFYKQISPTSPKKIASKRSLSKVSSNLTTKPSKSHSLTKSKLTNNQLLLHRVMYNREINKEIIKMIAQSTHEFFNQIEHEFNQQQQQEILTKPSNDDNKLITVYKNQFIPKLKEFLLIGKLKNQFENNESLEKLLLLKKMKLMHNNNCNNYKTTTSGGNYKAKNKAKLLGLLHKYYFTLSEPELSNSKTKQEIKVNGDYSNVNYETNNNNSSKNNNHSHVHFSKSDHIIEFIDSNINTNASSSTNTSHDASTCVISGSNATNECNNAIKTKPISTSSMNIMINNNKNKINAMHKMSSLDVNTFCGSLPSNYGINYFKCSSFLDYDDYIINDLNNNDSNFNDNNNNCSKFMNNNELNGDNAKTSDNDSETSSNNSDTSTDETQLSSLIEAKKCKKKIVRFADSLGLDLVSVKLINSMHSPNNSNDCYYGYSKNCFETSISWEDEFQFDSIKRVNEVKKSTTTGAVVATKINTSQTQSSSSSLINKPFQKQQYLVLIPCFTLSKYTYTNNYYSNENQLNCKLVDYVFDNENKLLELLIKVKNISFKKHVFLRFTLNNWKTYNDLVGQYTNITNLKQSHYQNNNSHSHHLNSKLNKQFCNDDTHYNYFKITLPIIEHLDATNETNNNNSNNNINMNNNDYNDYTFKIEFAICFNCDNNSYWDNNNGANYIFQCFYPKKNI